MTAPHNQTQITKSKREEIIRRMMNDKNFRLNLVTKSLYWFAYYYFGDKLKYEMADFQKEMISLLENPHKGLVAFAGFQGCGKSSLVTFIYPIWAVLGIQQKKFIVTSSQTQRQSEQHLLNIKEIMENNKALISDLGPFKPDRDQWGRLNLVISLYKAKILSASSEQAIRGMTYNGTRPDLIVLDDVESLESTKTEEGRKKTQEWFGGDIVPAGDINTKTAIVGTLFHEDSLLSYIEKRIEAKEMDGIFKKYPIISEKGAIAWPGKFNNMEAIEIEKRKGLSERDWQREFMMRIIGDDDQIIQPEWIKYYDVLPDENSQEKFLLTGTGVDLAISERQTADFTAMVSAKVYRGDQGIKIYILPNPINERLDFPTAIDRIKYLSRSLGSGIRTRVYVEDVQYQRSFPQQLCKDGFPATAVPLDGQDKRARLILASPLIQSGQILFPARGAEMLVKQLIGFGVEKHNDLVDALTILVSQIVADCDSIFCFARIDGLDFNMGSVRKADYLDGNQKLGLLPEKIQLPWKDDKELRELEKQLDLETHKNDLRDN